jgi:glycosyltransferase involved in cell wall biosynthesis
MRSLVVTRWVPWPPTSGARLRSATIIAGLAGLGDVDVVIVPSARVSDATDPNDVPAPEGVRVIEVAPRQPHRVTRRHRLATALPWSLPAAIRAADESSSHSTITRRLVGTYDLAWFVRIESWLEFGASIAAPAIVDFDDLRDRLLASRGRSTWPDPDGSPRASALGRLSTRSEAVAWRRLQRRVAREVAAVTVCSELDRRHLGVPNGAVVVNGVDIPDEPVGREHIGSPPTICLHGSLDYGPNADAAVVLVRDVLPLVRRSVPDAVVRLVGRHDGRVERFASLPGVEVAGFVPDIRTELARADVIAVPLRIGAGTRIKILEALAEQVPVVSTTLGIEGLDLEPGRHVLGADEPESFAAACVSLLTDAALRRELAVAGAARVRERYREGNARDAVRTLALGVAGSGAREDRRAVEP